MANNTQRAKASYPWFVWAIGAVAGVALIVFGVWTIAPLFVNRMVDEVFPGTEAMAAPTAMAGEAMAGEAMAAPTGEAMAATEPLALSTGDFTQIDALHGAKGSAAIYRLADGKLVLRLENFDAQNGPDLFVSLSGHPMPRSSAEAFDSGYLELARLKANQGNQNYELPEGIDLSQYKSVLIYCRAFNVVFSSAALGS